MVHLEKVWLSRDTSFVFQVMSSAEESGLFLRKVRFNSFEEFESWFRMELDRYYDRFYMIQDEQCKNLGFLYSYDYRPTDQHAHFSIYICPECRHLGAGIEASLLFANALFMEQNLRKLYSCVYGYNEESLQCNREAGFTEEGILKEDRYFNGRFWDTYIFSISREEFCKRYGRLIERLQQ